MPPPRRPRPDIEHTREALRRHDEEMKPEREPDVADAEDEDNGGDEDED